MIPAGRAAGQSAESVDPVPSCGAADGRIAEEPASPARPGPGPGAQHAVTIA